MGAFDHVTVLLSFVYALALTHLLSRAAAIYVARARVRFSWLTALMAVNGILNVLNNWLALWSLRSASSWDIASIACQFVFAIAVFFQCALAIPEAAPEGPIDLEAYFWREYRAFYSVALAGVLIIMAGNFTFLKTADPAAFWTWQIVCLVDALPIVLALCVRTRWMQYGAAITSALLSVAMCVALDGVLR
jgi:hypothetical protein